MGASHAQAIAAQGAGLQSYITQMMGDYYSIAPKESFSNHHTERGIELEESAATIFSFDHNVVVKKIGYVEYNSYVGASPDLFVGEDELGEIKCLASAGHLNALLGKIESKFIWQVQMQLLVCEKKVGHLIFYNPNFDQYLVVHRIEPDQAKFEKLKKGFAIGEALIKEIEGKMERLK